ncbi:MAG: hypothetical protein LBD59_10110, partial [Prevotellaceae bacterium]|nr:hypothetical protein [Prevotellaceae bacterium]
MIINVLGNNNQIKVCPEPVFYVFGYFKFITYFCRYRKIYSNKYAKHTTVTNEVLEDLKKGKHKAFEAVYMSCFDKVKRFITGLIRSEDDAEDLAQDIFAKIWIERETLNT